MTTTDPIDRPAGGSAAPAATAVPAAMATPTRRLPGVPWIATEALLVALAMVALCSILVQVAADRPLVVVPSFREGVLTFHPHEAVLSPGARLSDSPAVAEERARHAAGKSLDYPYRYGRQVMAQWRERHLSRDDTGTGRCVWHLRGAAGAYQLEVTGRSETDTPLQLDVAGRVVTVKFTGEGKPVLAEHVVHIGSGRELLSCDLPRGVELHRLRLVPVAPGG